MNRALTKNQKQYWIDKGHSEEEAIILVSAIQKSRSPRCKEYWVNKGYSESEALIKVVEIQRSRSTRCKEYWINRGCTEIEAEENVYRIQSELSAKSSKFKGKKHTNETKKRIAEFTKIHVKKLINRDGKDKWISHFKSKGLEIGCISKQERILYQTLVDLYPSFDIKANKLINGKVVDIIINDKKIIEFYGDYWHASPRIFNEDEKIKYPGNRIILASEIRQKDYERENFLIALGYDLLVIWEHDWHSKKQFILQHINEYINA